MTDITDRRPVDLGAYRDRREIEYLAAPSIRPTNSTLDTLDLYDFCRAKYKEILKTEQTKKTIEGLVFLFRRRPEAYGVLDRINTTHEDENKIDPDTATAMNCIFSAARDRAA